MLTEHVNRPRLLGTNEVTNNRVTIDLFAPAIFWTLIETSLGVVSACLPILRPLYKAYSIDSFINNVRSFTSTRLLRSRTATEGDSWRYSEAHSNRTQSLSSADAQPSYYIANSQNSHLIPLNAYHVKVKATRSSEDARSTEGIMVKSELTQQGNMV